MKKYLVELTGTFFLVLVIGLTGNPIAIGAVLMCMVYMGGHISGAHYNPAVTFALLVSKKIDQSEAIRYMGYQILGALLASFVVLYLKGTSFAPAPAPDASTLKAILVEVLFTFALVSVVLNVAVAKSNAGNSFYGLAIGFIVLGAAFAGGPISGGAFNPAVGIGPIIVDTINGGNSLSNLAIYLVGPLVGGYAAAYFYKVTVEEAA